MISSNKKLPLITCHSPRLQMTLPERIMFRIISYSTYGILIATTATFIISDVPILFWSGMLLFIFLINRWLKRSKAPKNLLHDRTNKEKINAFYYLTPQTVSLIENALDQQSISGGDIELNLLDKVLEKSNLKEYLARLEIDESEFHNQITSHLLEAKTSSGNKSDGKESSIHSLISKSATFALYINSPFIHPSHLFMAAIDNPHPNIASLLQTFNLKISDFQNIILFQDIKNRFQGIKSIPASIGGFAHHPLFIRPRIMNRAWTARSTPTLNKYGLDLTALARMEATGLLIGHHQEYEAMEDILAKPTKSNIILVGESGTGKSSLLAHLAFKIITDDVPDTLFDKRLISLDIGSLIAGANNEEVQARLKTIIQEIIIAGNIFLVIENIHHLIKSDGQSLNIADTLIPAIKSDAFSVISTTTPANYKKISSYTGDFISSFTDIKVNPVSKEEAELIAIFESIISENQYRHKTRITIPAIKSAVNVAQRFLTSEPLPGSAIKLIKESFADAHQNDEPWLDKNRLIAIAERKVNIPIHEVDSNETAKLLNMENIIQQKLVGQSEAVKAVSASLRQYRSGLKRTGGPIASFLFIGPTGVGKTELAKTIAAIQFGSESAMTRIDMTEFQDKQSHFRLIGSPDGSISGTLTDSVISKPYSLILLDEFEKAHPDILNLFLQVFDDGRLTDNLSRVVDFSNTIIIATSNVYSEEISTSLSQGEDFTSLTNNLKSKLIQYFRPELINRFSKIIAFQSLSPEDISAIASINLNRLSEDLMESKNIMLKFSPTAIQAIAKLGFNPTFGARPLREAIEDNIKNPLAERILRSEIKNGDTVLVDYINSSFLFQNQ